MSLPPIVRPLDYLRIRHPRKTNYDRWLPLGLTVITISILAVLPLPIQIFGDKGLLGILASLLQILVGFYIAALAAVATFDRPGMDQPMAGDAPELWVRIRDHKEKEHLTRRRFLCLMFGYLSLLSFILYIASAFGNLLEPNLHILIPHESRWFLVARWTFLTAFFFMAFNLLVTTLLGLYYMTDRIHRFDPEIVAMHKHDDSQND